MIKTIMTDEKFRLQEEMYHLIDTIKEVEVNMLEESVSIAEFEKELDEGLLRLKDEIANMEDGNGKPLYSNDTKRQAALLEMKAEDDSFAELEETIKNLRNGVAQSNIELRYQKNLLDVAKLLYRGLIND